MTERAGARADAGAPRWELAPLCWGMESAEFFAWLARAQAGERIAYAGGPALPREMPVVSAVSAAVAAGQVRTHIVKEEGRTLHIAVRRREPREAARAQEPELHGKLADLYRMLCSLAKKGSPCPTNAVFAIALDLKGAEAARYLFRQLEAGGWIATQNRGPRERRIVTIVKTGERTGG